MEFSNGILTEFLGLVVIEPFSDTTFLENRRGDYFKMKSIYFNPIWTGGGGGQNGFFG